MKQKQAFDGPQRARPHCLACEHPAVVGDVVRCPGCQSPYHPGCAQRLSGCRTAGCAHAPAAPPQISAAPRGSGDPTCPYCRTATSTNHVACTSCGTRYHRSCATALGTCATLGCQAEIRGHVLEQQPLRRRLSDTRARYGETTASETRARRIRAQQGALKHWEALPEHVMLKVFAGFFVPMLLTFVVLYLLNPYVKAKFLIMIGGWVLGGVVVPVLIPAFIVRRYRKQLAEEKEAESSESRAPDGVE